MVNNEQLSQAQLKLQQTGKNKLHKHTKQPKHVHAERLEKNDHRGDDREGYKKVNFKISNIQSATEERGKNERKQ